MEELSFVEFDEKFLIKSWEWINDPEIKSLIDATNITRTEQYDWFIKLDKKKNYLIWGILYKDKEIGVVGLKIIDKNIGEFWGYIGEKEYWGRGFGSIMLDFIKRQSIKEELNILRLKVLKQNSRAIRSYIKNGFKNVSIDDKWYHMRFILR